MTLFGEDLASPVRPEGDQAALPGEETGRKVTTITIDADGNYSTENGPLKLEEITAYLRENADPQTYVRIAASEKAKFEGVKALLDQVAKAQVKEITFEARTSEQAGQLKTSPL
jgi:biopolymer transport protein ExbD